MGCVYLLTNRVNWLMYVGQTIFTLEKRLDEHQRNTRHGSDYLLHTAIREFGIEAFEARILEQTDDPGELDHLEREHIARLNTNATRGGVGYNMTSGGQGISGYKWSQASKDKKIKHCPVSKEQLELDNQNLQLQEIADKYASSRSVVQGWFKKFGLVKERIQLNYHNQTTHPWTSDECDRAMELYTQCRSNKEIAEILGRTETAVLVKLIRLRRIRNTPRRYVRGLK